MPTNVYGAMGRAYNQQAAALAVHRPAAALPATAQAAIFTVAGGPILLKQLVGKLSVASDATATNLNPVANPASGVADVNLATATAVASLGIGTLIGPAGVGVGAALGKAGAISGLDRDIVVDIGTIDLLTSATNAAARASWLALYEPLVPGAYLIPALPTAGSRGLAITPVGLPRRIRRRAASVPATAQAAIFGVQGGPILLWSLTGKVTTVASATATNLTVVANPTSGLTDVNLCTATAIANTALGTILSLQAAGIGTALGKAGAAAQLLTPIIVDIGTIDLLTSATNTMQAEWTAIWQPLHPSGRLVVA